MESDLVRISLYMFLKILIFISIFFIVRRSIVKILFRKMLNSEKNPEKKNKIIVR